MKQQLEWKFFVQLLIAALVTAFVASIVFGVLAKLISP